MLVFCGLIYIFNFFKYIYFKFKKAIRNTTIRLIIKNYQKEFMLKKWCKSNKKNERMTTIKVHLVVSFMGFVYLWSIINNS